MAPQTFHVIRCVECSIFQVHIIKKSSNKWNCKVCSTKQSVQQVFGKGSGAECRDLVQRLNLARGVVEDQRRAAIVNKINEEIIAEELGLENSDGAGSSCSNTEEVYQREEFEEPLAKGEAETSDFRGNTAPIKQSKWSKYLEEENDDANYLY